ncbi:hypothetical protein L2E82_40497 [Cichorium intybus]|uniref:Uncharacterized protein n=1 Tax=Cichorium intybus TaxID=13427 RepID=A0ACB9ALX5_CICIN|nr:hypothetical protein L2E82_40497 [Cichorium intybus]
MGNEKGETDLVFVICDNDQIEKQKKQHRNSKKLRGEMRGTELEERVQQGAAARWLPLPELGCDTAVGDDCCGRKFPPISHKNFIFYIGEFPICKEKERRIERERRPRRRETEPSQLSANDGNIVVALKVVDDGGGSPTNGGVVLR